MKWQNGSISCNSSKLEDSASKWTAHPLDIRDVHGSDPSLDTVNSGDPLHASNIDWRRWCIHPGFKTHGWSQPKSETESTGGSTKCWHCHIKNWKIITQWTSVHLRILRNHESETVTTHFPRLWPKFLWGRVN